MKKSRKKAPTIINFIMLKNGMEITLPPKQDYKNDTQ